MDLKNLTEIREILNIKYDDPELEALCLDYFPELYDKFSRGLRKDEKITLLLDYCRRLPIRWDKLLRLVGESLEEQTFHLPFANRETEKELIQTLLKAHFYVQIYAPGGLGKTYMLQEMQRELEAVGWQTVWVDFAAELHHSCRADRYQFLQVFAQQLLGQALAHDLDEKQLYKRIGRHIANLDQVALFLDNADWADIRLLRWIREGLLQTLADDWGGIRVLASAQQVIPEWQGVKRGRPFRQLSLSKFDDPKVIQEIIEYVVAHFGAKRAKARFAEQNETSQANMSKMVYGLLQLSRGHPLIMAEVLRYTANEDGFMNATFFSDNWAQLCERCLIPMVGGRILPTVDSAVREAFRSLCVFRYASPMLIRTLTNPTTPDEPWEPFGTSRKPWAIWWAWLENTHLLYPSSSRPVWHISPVIRQVIAVVLRAENEMLYLAHNRRARLEYERLLASESVVPTEQATYLLELFYHATQDGSLSAPEAGKYFEKRLNQFLNDLSDSSFPFVSQLLGWLREDAELQSVINQLAASDIYGRLLQLVDDFIRHKKNELKIRE